MRYLKENYNLLSLNKATQILLTKGTFPKNSIVITFDDGYKDNFNNALPILNKYDIPATIFLATNFISKNPFYLSWGDIQKMKNKIDFGSHTCSHKILTNLTTKESTKEIINSKKEIEEIIKKKVYSFAYPMGSKENFNDEIKKIVAKSGFLCACSSIHGTNNAKMDLFELKRKFVIERDINLFAYNLLF
jgi:peptidoglycan/xylan/chitin deacetylase (PgdA/CDA1 family)